MKRIKSTIVLFFAIVSLQNAYSQNNETKPDFGVKFNGYVKTAVFYDTRQMVSAREGYLHIYPTNEKKDINGEDINAKNNFNILSIESRLKASIYAPDVLNAKTSGVLEGEFFGTSNDNTNGFRLRHAFLKLNWKKTELLIGQTWNPMLNPDACPGTISFNTGMTFQPFSRNPQVRVSHKIGWFKVLATVASERDMTSTGPVADTLNSTGKSSSSFLQSSGMPLFNVQLQLNPDSTNFLIAIGGGYKRLTPLNSYKHNGKTYKTDESIESYDAMALVKVKFNPITITAQTVYTQNGASLFMLGGYAVQSVDAVTGERKYTNIETVSSWIDVRTNGKVWQAGLFAGYSENLGSEKDIYSTKNIYSFNNISNIQHVYRVAPRLSYTFKKAVFAFEYDYSVAAYGTIIDSKAKVEDSKEIANNRFLFTAALNF